MSKNIDVKTVSGFGDEWSRFNQSELSEAELNRMFWGYFHIFPFEFLPRNAEGFDLGCGSGRWAQLVSDKVGKLHCIDASIEALDIAKRNLETKSNCQFHHASVDEIPLKPNSMDFGYSLGVLHHVPSTADGIKACTRVLKEGAPFLLYLYYAFDNRPAWFRCLWRMSDTMRRAISQLPRRPRYWTSQILAGLLYYPLARSALILESLGVHVSSFPLSSYRRSSFYTMRTDALDRFGTRLEHRFTALAIKDMMKDAGLENISFSDSAPYWCAIGYKRKQ